jgi:hypothetical protein
MPKKEINYGNTVMYKIVCKELTITEVYVGHTTDFRRRKNEHKSSCNNPERNDHNMKVYKFIRENGGWENWVMIEIEKFVCVDGNEARKRERYWIEHLNATLNNNIPTRTFNEYINDNKVVLQEKRKLYFEKPEVRRKLIEYKLENAEQIKAKKKEKVVCECGVMTVRNNMWCHKQTKKHQNAMLKNQ